MYSFKNKLTQPLAVSFWEQYFIVFPLIFIGNQSRVYYCYKIHTHTKNSYSFH